MFSLTKNIDAKVAYILEELSNNNMRVNVKIPLQNRQMTILLSFANGWDISSLTCMKFQCSCSHGSTSLLRLGFFVWTKQYFLIYMIIYLSTYLRLRLSQILRFEVNYHFEIVTHGLYRFRLVGPTRVWPTVQTK